MFRDRDFIKDSDEFDSIREVLKGYGITSFRYTELHDPSENINDFLKNFSHNQLKAIALEFDPRINVHLDRLEKRYLVTYLSAKFDFAQQKSKEFIYAMVMEEKNKADTVNESSNKPGSDGVSK